jgi:hypothetical protein
MPLLILSPKTSDKACIYIYIMCVCVCSVGSTRVLLKPAIVLYPLAHSSTWNSFSQDNVLRRDRDGDRTQVQKKCNMARFWCTLSILISRFLTFTLNHPVRGLANDSPLENPVSRYQLLLLPRQADRTLNSSLATVTTVAKFPKWTQFL